MLLEGVSRNLEQVVTVWKEDIDLLQQVSMVIWSQKIVKD